MIYKYKYLIQNGILKEHFSAACRKILGNLPRFFREFVKLSAHFAAKIVSLSSKVFFLPKDSIV